MSERPRFERNFKFSMEKTLNSRKNGNISSSYTGNSLCCSDVYNLAQKFRSNCQDYWSRWTEESCHGQASYLQQSVYEAGRVTLLLG